MHIWDNKTELREIYRGFHQFILANCRPGLTLRIGVGPGCLKFSEPKVVRVDIQVMPSENP